MSGTTANTGAVTTAGGQSAAAAKRAASECSAGNGLQAADGTSTSGYEDGSWQYILLGSVLILPVLAFSISHMAGLSQFSVDMQPTYGEKTEKHVTRIELYTAAPALNKLLARRLTPCQVVRSPMPSRAATSCRWAMVRS